MKTIIITGVSGNLGQSVAKKFLRENLKVIETVTVDLMNEDEAEKFVQQVIDKHKIIDVAVLTVGGFAMGTIAETKMTDILKQHKLNFQTTYHAARPIFLQMVKQENGRI